MKAKKHQLMDAEPATCTKSRRPERPTQRESAHTWKNPSCQRSATGNQPQRGGDLRQMRTLLVWSCDPIAWPCHLGGGS